MLADLFGNPTPDSEIRDMRENVAKQALDAAIKYQGIYRAIYDLKLYQNNKKFADAIKCTVHPKDGQIGVYPVSESVRIFPHHGQGFYKAPIGRISATKDIRVGFAADLLRSTTGKTLQGITLNPEKYPFAEPGHPFLVRPELLH